jgi:acyl-coenzyme A synthetase/AMP-(fatty) acid ligase/thioesterase domain-containing protein/aryl carrier-like protein
MTSNNTSPFPVAARFHQAANLHPDRLAFEHAGTTTTYRSLQELVESRTGQFDGMVERPENPVGLTQSTNLDLVVTILALADLGRPFVYLDPAWSRERRDQVLRKTKAQLMPRHEAKLSETSPSGLSTRSSPFVLTSTSGNSGTPKIVVRSQDVVARNIINYQATCKIQPEHRIALTAPPSHGPFVSQFLGALLHGASLHPFDLRKLGTKRLAVWLRENKISHVHLVPAVFRRLATIVAAEGISLPALHTVRLGGEPVTAADVVLFRRAFSPETRLLNGYSASEAGGNICCHELEPEVDYSTGGVPVGKPVAGRIIEIVNSEGVVLPPLQEGRIVVTSADLADGYWDDEDLTNETFRGEQASRKWWSQDRGYLSEDGTLVHLGRRDGKVKVLGRLVDLDASVRSLMALDAIRQASCHHTAEDGLVAFLETDLKPSSKVLKQWRLAASLGGEAMGAWRFVCRRRFPLKENGKVDLQALKRDLHQETPSSGDGLHVPEIEKILCQTLGELLNRQVSAEDNFFQLGGNSLLAAEWLMTISKSDVTLGFADLVSANTLAELAERTRLQSRRRFILLSSKAGSRPLILIPGNTGSVSEFVSLQPAVQGLQRTVIGFDVMGETTPSSLQSLVTENLQVLEQKGPQDFDLMGWCSGARVALELAQKLREQSKNVRVFLIDPPPPNSSKLGQTYRKSRGIARELVASVRRAGTHLRKLSSGPLRDRTRHANHLLRTANLLLRFQRWTPPEFPREERELQRRAYSELSHSEPWGTYNSDVWAFLSEDRSGTHRKWKAHLHGGCFLRDLRGNHDNYCLQHWKHNLKIINRELKP